MKDGKKYASPAAMRTALEERLNRIVAWWQNLRRGIIQPHIGIDLQFLDFIAFNGPDFDRSGKAQVC